MTSRSASAWTVVVLTALGIAGIIARLNLDLEASDSDCLLCYSSVFHVHRPDGRMAVASDARLFAAIPEATRYCKVVKHEVNAPEMEPVRYRIHNAESRRNVVLRTDVTGELACEVSFRLHLDATGDWRQSAPQLPLTANDRSRYLANANGITANNNKTAEEMLNRLRDGHPAPQQLVERIFKECRTGIESTGPLGESSGDATLLHLKGSPVGRARAMVLLCRAAKIPARLATGFQIKKGEDVQPHSWVEVYVNRWEPYDLENGYDRELPKDFVAVRHESVYPVRVTNSTDLETKYAIREAPPVARTLLSILDLRRLPDKLKEPVKVVLILPLGALFTAFVRTIIGIRTFGTFSPTLLALAFVYNDFRSGLCIFAVVLATGFISRGVLDRLKLLLVPRLSIILTLVVMLMVLGIAVMNYFNDAPGGQTVLLPMVILTNLVERFYVTSEEDNFLLALRLMITTLLMSLVIYLLLNWKVLGDLLFNYPELHFFTVAVLVVMGRYTGYRLTELVRFRDLVQPPRG